MMSASGQNELALMAAQGDAGAFERLLAESYDNIYRLCYRLMGVREDAEDVAQEVCVKLGRAISAFEGRSSFRTWAYRITVNAVRDYQRKGAVRRSHEERFVREEALAQGGGAGNPVAAEEIYRAMGQLPEKLRATLVLVCAEGLTHKEAAGVLGCAETTVSWRVFQARRKLRPLFQKNKRGIDDE